MSKSNAADVERAVRDTGKLCRAFATIARNMVGLRFCKSPRGMAWQRHGMTRRVWLACGEARHGPAR